MFKSSRSPYGPLLTKYRPAIITPIASSSACGTGSVAARGQTARSFQSQSNPAKKVTNPAQQIPVLSRISHITGGRLMLKLEHFSC